MGPTPERRTPVRTCIGCRKRVDSGALVRCRMGADGVGRCARNADGLGGRGAWICAESLACFDTAAARGAFARAWRCNVAADSLATLRIAFGSPDPNMRESWVAGSAGHAALTKG